MKKSAFTSALSIGILSIGMAFADPAAVSQIRDNSVQVLKILNQANGKNNAQVLKQAEDYASPYFDFQKMTILAVGRPWASATAAQRKELVESFKSMMRYNYANMMLAYKNAKVDVKDKPTVKGKVIEVNTTLSLPNGKSVNAAFVTYKNGNRFMVYDVTVEGASLVTAQRQKFGEIVQKSGIDGLIAHLKSTNNSGKK